MAIGTVKLHQKKLLRMTEVAVNQKQQWVTGDVSLSDVNIHLFFPHGCIFRIFGCIPVFSLSVFVSLSFLRFYLWVSVNVCPLMCVIPTVSVSMVGLYCPTGDPSLSIHRCHTSLPKSSFVSPQRRHLLLESCRIRISGDSQTTAAPICSWLSASCQLLREQMNKIDEGFTHSW